MSQSRLAEFVVYQNNDFNFQHQIFEAGSPLNITGATVQFRARRDGTTTSQIDESSSGGNITLTTPASGIADLDLSDTQTEALTPGFYYYEWKITESSGEEHTTRTGWFEVKESLFA